MGKKFSFACQYFTHYESGLENTWAGRINGFEKKSYHKGGIGKSEFLSYLKKVKFDLMPLYSPLIEL
jgi:hypothetical protein